MYIKAIKHIRRPRGGSQAQLMAADDGHEYVVKFQGNPQTTRILANDYLAVGPNGWIERTRAGHHLSRCQDHSGIQDRDPLNRHPVLRFGNIKNITEFARILGYDKWNEYADARQV